MLSQLKQVQSHHLGLRPLQICHLLPTLLVFDLSLLYQDEPIEVLLFYVLQIVHQHFVESFNNFLLLSRCLVPEVEGSCLGKG